MIRCWPKSLLTLRIGHRQSRKLTHVLRNFAAQGVQTNREFLIAVLESEEFRDGRAHTGFQLPVSSEPDEELDRVFCAATRAYVEKMEHARRAILPSIPLRFRNNPTAAPAMKFAIGKSEYQVADVRRIRNRNSCCRRDHVDALIFIRKARRAASLSHPATWRGILRALNARTAHSHAAAALPGKDGGEKHQSANSPMPGQVLRILVAPGQQVKPGDGLVVLEAMKMEQTIKATIQGVVRAVLVKASAGCGAGTDAG